MARSSITNVMIRETLHLQLLLRTLNTMTTLILVITLIVCLTLALTRPLGLRLQVQCSYSDALHFVVNDRLGGRAREGGLQDGELLGSEATISGEHDVEVDEQVALREVLVLQRHAQVADRLHCVDANHLSRFRGDEVLVPCAGLPWQV